MVFEKVKAIIVEQTGRDAASISMETSFRDDLEADSLDLFQIINDIEDAYDIKIDDVEGIVTVGDAVRFVEANKA